MIRIPPSELGKPSPPRFLLPGKLARLQAQRRADRARRAARAVVAVLAVLLLAGCGSESRTSARYTGTIGGQAVDVAAVEATSTNTGPDLAAMLGAALAALRGDLAAIAAQVQATPPPQPPVPPAALAAEVWKAAPPAALAAPTEPATLTGNSVADTLLATLVAYLTGRGGIHVAGRLKRKANP